LFGVNTAAEIGGKEGQAITIERLHTQATTTTTAAAAANTWGQCQQHR
jgi:hypothetical protein